MGLELDATDDPVHGEQEGRFFHGYYDCYCYLPLYVFCGRHLLAAKLRPASVDAAAGAVEEVARIVAQIRDRWANVRIMLRADSGFAREELMAWCEANSVHFLFGLQQNKRLWPRWQASWRGPRQRAGGPKSRHGSSRSSCIGRAAAGAAGAGSSARRSLPRAKPILASSLPR